MSKSFYFSGAQIGKKNSLQRKKFFLHPYPPFFFLGYILFLNLFQKKEIPLVKKEKNNG
jgi:hypothetical protein